MTQVQQELFTDLSPEQSATVEGGGKNYEVFTMYNKSSYDVELFVDGKSWTHKPGQKWIWTAKKGGIVKFDQDGRSGVTSYKQYNLANGGIYTFFDNKKTPGNPYDVELYTTG